MNSRRGYVRRKRQIYYSRCGSDAPVAVLPAEPVQEKTDPAGEPDESLEEPPGVPLSAGVEVM